MLKLTIAAVAALVIGFTVRDLTTASSPGPEAAWEEHVTEVGSYISDAAVAGDAHERLSETGSQIKDWLLDSVGQQGP